MSRRSTTAPSSSTTAADVLNGLVKFGVAALAITSGMPAGANARGLTGRNNQQYPLPHYSDAGLRANCSANIADATHPENAKQMFSKRHVDLTGCWYNVPTNGTCEHAIGGNNQQQFFPLREPHKKLRWGKNEDVRTQKSKIAYNAYVLYRALSCGATQYQIISELKAQGLDYKKNKEQYQQKVGEIIIQNIRSRNLAVDGVSLLFQDGKIGKELCLTTNERRKAYGAAKVAVVLNPETCEVKGIHPMVSSIECAKLCDELIRLNHKNIPEPTQIEYPTGRG